MERYRRQHRLDRGMKLWLITHAKKNYWKVSGHMDLDDLIQEGFICYAKCNQKYPMGLEPRHFMALVKTTFENHIRTLSAARHKRVDWPMDQLIDRDVDWKVPEIEIAEPEEQTFAVTLSQLPAELRKLITILMTDAKNIPMIRTITESGRSIPETRNSYLCRLAGISSDRDVESELREHFAM